MVGAVHLGKAHVGHFLDVRTRSERLVAAGEDRAPLPLIGVERGERGEQIVEHLRVERVDRKSTRSELQSLMRITYAVFCLKKKKNNTHINYNTNKITRTRRHIH